jgi:hypothetical protein
LNQLSLLGSRHKIHFNLRVSFARIGVASNKNNIDGLLEIVLMPAKHFTEETASAGARDGIADFARSDYPKARSPLPCF